MRRRLFPDGVEGCPQDTQRCHTRIFHLEPACRVNVPNGTRPRKAEGVHACLQVSNLLSQTLTTVLAVTTTAPYPGHAQVFAHRCKTRHFPESLSTEFSVLVSLFNSSPKSLFSSPTHQSSPLAATKCQAGTIIYLACQEYSDCTHSSEYPDPQEHSPIQSEGGSSPHHRYRSSLILNVTADGCTATLTWAATTQHPLGSTRIRQSPPHPAHVLFLGRGEQHREGSENHGTHWAWMSGLD